MEDRGPSHLRRKTISSPAVAYNIIIIIIIINIT